MHKKRQCYSKLCVVIKLLSPQGALPRLVALDDSAPGFSSAVRRLDACGARACVTVHVFCARAGQLNAQDIVNNVRSLSTVPPAFVRMLRGYGHYVISRFKFNFNLHEFKFKKFKNLNSCKPSINFQLIDQPKILLMFVIVYAKAQHLRHCIISNNTRIKWVFDTTY